MIQPTTIRVNEMLVGVGDIVAAGTPILTSSVASTFVTVELSTDDQDLVAVGDAVVVELPSGELESAVVTEIGSVVLYRSNSNRRWFVDISCWLVSSS